MRYSQIRRIKIDAEISQVAVSMLIWNPNFSADQKMQLRRFLQDHLDNDDLKFLPTFSTEGRVKFLRQRFQAYLASAPKNSDPR